MNLYEQINTWLLGYTPLNNWIYFNATPFIIGSVAINSVPGDRVTKKFIDGSKQKEIIFAIDFVNEYDPDGTSNINMNSLKEVENLADWIEQQTTLPNFGTDNTIQKIEVLTNVPGVYIDETQSLAKYQFQVRITYKDESEVN